MEPSSVKIWLIHGGKTDALMSHSSHSGLHRWSVEWSRKMALKWVKNNNNSFEIIQIVGNLKMPEQKISSGSKLIVWSAAACIVFDDVESIAVRSLLVKIPIAACIDRELLWLLAQSLFLSNKGSHGLDSGRMMWGGGGGSHYWEVYVCFCCCLFFAFCWLLVMKDSWLQSIDLGCA